MRKLSIKARITLWYTTLIVLLMTFVLAFIFISADRVLLSQAKDGLKETTLEMSEMIELEDGEIDFEEEYRDYQEGMSLLVINENDIIRGEYPQNFPAETPLQTSDVITVSQGNQSWLIYDIAIGNDLFARGIFPLEEISGSMNLLILIAILVFPFISVLAAAGGYFITRKALRPVSQIAAAATRIGNDSDLTRRINLDDNGDEISTLAKTFDRMLDKLEQSFESEKQFTSDVSHELRTPISVMKSQCEYALTRDNDHETQEALLNILSQTDHMALLVSQLLELSRADQQVNQLAFEPINLSELLVVVTEELQEAADLKSIRLTTTARDNHTAFGITAQCEQTLMMRLMLNLISNAIKYTEVKGTVEASLTENNGKIVLKVSDTGIGIAREHLDKIFNRFYQVDPSRTGSEQNGFGLGLFMCKWIAEVHHGTMSVTSEVGKGSTFEVTIPARME